MAEIRNVILDWSGTLVDDFNPVLEASNEIFKQYGKPAFTAEEFREKFYLPFPAFYKEYLPELVIEGPRRPLPGHFPEHADRHRAVAARARFS